MTTNLTGSTIATTYSQLLHLDGGPTATPKVVYSGVGTATVMKLGTISVEFNNIKLDGNTISSIDLNGNINFAPNGTGAVVIPKVTFSDAAQARTSLGLGTIATQDADDVGITGGSITGITDLAVADGGTGASDAAGARTNLGLGSMATQAASAVAITGGTISATLAGNVTGYIILPTADPEVVGALWNNAGTITISAG